MPVSSYRKPSDLPEIIPVFPLDGAVLLPRAVLPLNIFEPRHLNMVDDALSGHRVIGMIQTRPGGSPEHPRLQSVGCAGRLTSFSETPDSRYLISLTGACRFSVGDELEVATPYRQVRPAYEPFASDLSRAGETTSFDREELLGVLRTFLVSNDLAADWSSMENVAAEQLVNSLAMACPFDTGEKQALLEAPTLDARCEALMTLMRLRAAGPDGGVA